MPIICLEGASGVGKSTTCKELATGFNDVVKGYVHIHEAKSIQNNVDYFISNKQSFVKPNENSFSLELFDLLINWLKTNKPKDRL